LRSDGARLFVKCGIPKEDMEKRLNFVDLFAGCGGLSLGLEQAGFHPVFVNELNSHAMETYLANRMKIEPLLGEPQFHCYDVKQLVVDKNFLPALERGLKEKHRIDVGGGELDLLVGGPPCQGYSGIGHRRSYSVAKEQLPSNFLYEDMVYVISKLRPKLFLFENVKGLLSARWTPGGAKGEIWQDVHKKFVSQLGDGYFIGHHLVMAKEYGVPQNRPRVLMVGLRRDIAKGFVPDSSRRADGLLPEPQMSRPPHPVELLGDLCDPGYRNGGETKRYPSPASSEVQEVLRRDPQTGKVRPKGATVTEHEYSNHAPKVIKKFEYMLAHGGRIHPSYKTKKFAQRVLPEKWPEATGPTITATSLPDDYVHYCQARTLTVREWARLQLFPDWYQFKGKRTTGGVRRAGNPQQGVFEREVPKYTQIGNAVPVGLAKAVGVHFKSLLKGASARG